MTDRSIDTLKALFSPSSVAVIGASKEKGKLGHIILSNIIKRGFSGKIYPINPKYDEILGLKTYKSLLEIKNKVDLAVIVVPSKAVLGVVKECQKAEIKGTIIISAGFGEAGAHNVEGEISEIAKNSGMKVIGPNCQGVISSRSKLFAWFGPIPKRNGNVLFITQSGALAGMIIGWANHRNLPLFDTVVSVGNKCDIEEAEIIEYFSSDPHIKAIMIYLEGLKDGRRFIEVATRVTRVKPIIVLKGGKSRAGARATMSHTGSLAGSDRIYAAAFKQAGIIRAESIRNMINTARIFAKQFPPKGGKVAIITNLGGPGVITADMCEKYGLNISKFSDETVLKLKEKLPSYCTVSNPLDLTGDPDPTRYKIALKEVYSDKEVDCVIIVAGPLVGGEVVANFIVDFFNKYKKPTAVCWVTENHETKEVKILEESGIPTYEMPEDAVKSMAALVTYAEYLQKESIRKSRGNL